MPHESARGWHSRGYLPHFDGGEVAQTVMFRLAGSLPRALLDTWADELQWLPRLRADAELRQRIEEYLDRGIGEALLNAPAVAGMVEEALLYFDGERYRLHAWAIMPNHVHVLVMPLGESALSAILHSWKSFTAKQANRILGREGAFWSADYFDRFVRDERHFAAALSYTEENPVKARLCSRRQDWPFGSARLRVVEP
jgi:putative DNA methylase